MASLEQIYSWFETGDFPTEAQFRATFASFFHKDKSIPQEKIEGLARAFQGTLSAQDIKDHNVDEAAHGQFLARVDASNLSQQDKEKWRSLLAIGDGYTREELAEVIATLHRRDDENADRIGELRELLASNDISLDELQEIVNYIKQNREDIDQLQALTIGETVESKVKMEHHYALLNDPATQADYNAAIYQYILSQNNSEMVAVVRGSASINHTFNTDKLIIQVRDSVTGKSMHCEDYAFSSHVQINFLEDIVNPCNVLIKKINS